MQKRSKHTPPDFTLQDCPGQFLSAGFRDVDGSGEAGVYWQCLDFIAGIPFFREVKEDSIRIILETDPCSVLDAGCGTGTDLLALSCHIPTGCRIAGLDASRSLLSRAMKQTQDCRDQCALIQGDLLAIPCRNEVFDAARIDRVLQHIREPVRAIRELSRILAPGGVLVAFDNDWDTFRIELDDRDLALRLTRFFRDSFASGRVGHEIAGLFRACDLEDIRVEPRTLVLTNFPIAWQLFDLSALLHRTEAAGVVTPAEAAEVRIELSRRTEEETFSAGYTGHLVCGVKPVTK